jgi:RimJ/RimL family protein N-acetyltransferase
MNCISYTCTKETFRPSLLYPVQWLEWDRDYPLARDFWPHGISLSVQDWTDARDGGYEYCAIMKGRKIVSMAAVLCYSDREWMLAAVRTQAEWWGRGYGKSVCSFVTACILESGRVATTTTAVSNVAMQRTAESIGFRAVP